jgi:predicted transposase/invertase (TIGR01784 family)
MAKSTKYDSAWKDMIENLFEDFLLFFFPDVYNDIDFTKGYEFLNNELRTIVKDNEIGKRFADELVKVYLKDGSEKWLLIHIEVQGYREEKFKERIFVYNYRIFDKYKKEVISLAILTDSDAKYRPNSYNVNRWNFSFSINFPLIKIIDYKNRINELEQSENPFAIIVLAHLKLIEAKQDNNKKFDAKVYLIKTMFKKGYLKDKIKEVLVFIDWVIQLPKELEIKFDEELTDLKGENLMAYVTTWERKGMKKGEIEKAIKIAKNMIDEGFDINLVKKITGLSIKEIEKLQQNKH